MKEMLDDIKGIKITVKVICVFKSICLFFKKKIAQKISYFLKYLNQLNCIFLYKSLFLTELLKFHYFTGYLSWAFHILVQAHASKGHSANNFWDWQENWIALLANTAKLWGSRSNNAYMYDLFTITAKNYWALPLCQALL